MRSLNWSALPIKHNVVMVMLMTMVCGTTWGQIDPEIQSVFDKMKAKYENAKSISMALDYNVYKGNSTKPVQTSRGHFNMKGEYSSMRVMGVTQLQNAEMQLMVDDSSRMIVANPVIKNPNYAEAMQLSVVDMCDSAVVVNRVGNVSVYRLFVKPGLAQEIGKLDIKIDSETSFIKELVMYYNYQMDFNMSSRERDIAIPRLQIIYQDVKINSDIPSSTFSTKRYFKSITPELVPNPKYSNYEVIDQRKP